MSEMADPADEMYRLIGRRLREAREAMGLTQDDVARRLDLDQVSYGRYESANRRVALPTLRQIAALLGRPMGYFLDLSVPTNDELWLHELLALPPEARAEAREHLRYLRHKYLRDERGREA